MFLQIVKKLLGPDPEHQISCIEDLNELRCSVIDVQRTLHESDPDSIVVAVVPGYCDIQHIFWPCVREIQLKGKKPTSGNGVKSLCDTPSGAAVCCYLAWPICRQEADRHLPNSHLVEID